MMSEQEQVPYYGPFVGEQAYYFDQPYTEQLTEHYEDYEQDTLVYSSANGAASTSARHSRQENRHQRHEGPLERDQSLQLQQYRSRTSGRPYAKSGYRPSPLGQPDSLPIEIPHYYQDSLPQQVDNTYQPPLSIFDEDLAPSRSLLPWDPPQLIPIATSNGPGSHRLIQYIKAITEAMHGSIEELENVCTEHHTDDSKIKMVLTDPETGVVKEHEILATFFPRLMFMQRSTGARAHELTFEGTLEETQFVLPVSNSRWLPAEQFQVFCPRVVHTTHFLNGTSCAITATARYKFRYVPSSHDPNSDSSFVLKVAYHEMIYTDYKIFVRPGITQVERPAERPRKFTRTSYTPTATNRQQSASSQPEVMVGRFGLAPAVENYIEVAEMLHEIGDV